MDCCNPNASPRKKALLTQFQQILDQAESERSSDEGRGISQAYKLQNRQGPMAPPIRPVTTNVQQDHMCPPGYHEGARTVRLPASASAPDDSKACPESCTDILADQERRSRERRQLEAHPGDLKIGEPKICPPGYPNKPQHMSARAQPGGQQKPHAMEQNRYKQGGMADPKMCPPEFSVGLSPNLDATQDPRCAVDYEKCAPKMRPGVCGPSELGHNPLGSREKTKSRELIGGVLLTGCDCIKRNGLQHDCKRSLCQGRPECLTNPPMCLPSGGPGCIPASYFES